jgi:hypothetical protein
LDFSYNYVLDKIAGGNAIYDAYLEFVECGGQKDTLFYEYAIGDAISEYQLLKNGDINEKRRTTALIFSNF